MLPPAVTLAQVTSAPCELGGFALPKYTKVTYSPFVTHHLPELYEQPDRFSRPERWETMQPSPCQFSPIPVRRRRVYWG